MNGDFFLVMRRDCSSSSSAASDRTVVLTVATSNDYLTQSDALAESAWKYLRLPCIHVSMPSELIASIESHPRLEPLSLPSWVKRWRPEAEFCVKRQSGWRQAHILKTQALLILLQRGNHVMLLDADRRLTGNPLPALLSTGMDVAGMRDEAFLNFGLALVRSNARATALASRVANRSLAAWDQAILAEELLGAQDVTCCFANAFIKRCVDIVESVHRLNKNAESAEATQWRQVSRCEPPDATAAAFTARRHIFQLFDRDHDQGQHAARLLPKAAALPPPTRGAMFRTWHPRRYNELPLSARRYSRCTRAPCQPTAPLECNASEGIAARDGRRARELHCTGFPPNTERMADEARCLRGNELDDGFQYVYNAHRGTMLARCRGSCACCRRLRPT